MLRRTLGITLLAFGVSARAQSLADPVEIIATNCLECHAGPSAWAGVRLDEWTAETGPEAAVAEAVLEAVRTRHMPPKERAPLSDADYAALVTWLSEAIPVVDDANALTVDPGWFAVRRLSRQEYANSLADILGLEPTRIDAESRIPHDDLGHGFDNNAAVLSVSDVHIEGYLDVAERAIDLALGPAVDPSGEYRRLNDLTIDRGGRMRRGGAHMFSNGTVSAGFRAEIGGRYRARVSAWGDRGGDDLPRAAVVVNGERIHAAEVEATSSQNADEIEIEFTLPAGAHEIGAAFVNDFYEPGVADRNLAIGRIDIAGPIGIDPNARPPLHRSLFPGGGPAHAMEQRPAAEHAVEILATRAFRRPPTAGEFESLMGLYERARLEGLGFEQAVRRSLLATLISPAFLFLAPDQPADSTAFIGSFAAASRLSYTLWNGPPDAELLRLAELGLLSDRKVVTSQVERMLDDARAARFVESFVGQWLLLRNLPVIEFDPDRFASFDDELRSFMIAEVEGAFADAVRRNLPPHVLLDSDTAYLNERLAEHYGIEGVRGDWIRPVRLPEGSPRGGVLTTGAVLALTSNPTRSSPVKRGLFVLDQLLGTPPPPPPPDIPPLSSAAKEGGEDLSPRELLALHAADPTCFSCHSRMDPIGLALENFDAVGKWRDEMYGRAIDTSGELPSGERFDGPRELREMLLDREEKFVRRLAERLLVYAIGRGLEPSDEASLDAIIAEYESRGGGTADLIAAVATSPAFLHHRPREVEVSSNDTARHGGEP